MAQLIKMSKKPLMILLSLIISLSMGGIHPLTTKAYSSTNYTGHNSWSQLTTSNGLGAALFSTTGSDHALTRFQPHIYSNYDANTTTRNYMYDAYFGYGIQGANGGHANWLNTANVDSAKYVNGTNVINVDQSDQSNHLQFDGYYFTPFSGPNNNQSRTLVMLMKVTNTSSLPQNVSIFSLQNLHMGTGDYGTDNEQASYNSTDNYLKEYNGNNIAIYKSLNQSDNEYYQAGNGDINPWSLASSTGQLNNVAQGGNDIAAGFENSGTTLDAGASKWYGIIIGLTEDGNEGNLSNDVNALAQPAMNNPEKLLTQEEDWWANWHSTEKMPAGLSYNERQVYRQSTAVLKMAQCKESGPGYGQIVASLIPGQWSITWARDSNYSIQALTESGHYQEAKEALNFLFNAKMRQAADGGNYYQENYIENPDTSTPTYGLDVPLTDNYLISVCRYFGNGTEDSDINDNGYNIEFDGWGLSLWSADKYVTATGDTQFLKDNWNKLKNQDANLLVELMEPSTNLIVPDSSIWEEHWTPYDVLKTVPSRQHFAFTDITVYQGLKSAAHLAELMGDTTDETTYNYKADEIQKAVLKNLVVDNKDIQTIASSTERKAAGYNFNDASTVEAINFGLVDPQNYLAAGMINAFNNNLHITTGSTPGYMRDQDGSSYDSNEWGFIDMRVAGALAKMGRDSESKTLLDWMTSQTMQNYDLIPELFDENTQNYVGSVPMVGFGSGSYILGLNDYYNQKETEDENAATNAVDKASASMLQSDVDSARVLVDQLPESDVKTNLSYQLESIQKSIDDHNATVAAESAATSAVEIAEASLKQGDLDRARTLVNQLGASIVKTDLSNRLDTLQKSINAAIAEDAAITAVAKAEATLSPSDVNTATDLVNKLSAGDLKTQLLRYLSNVQQEINQVTETKKKSEAHNETKTKETAAYTAFLIKNQAVRISSSSHSKIIGTLKAGSSVKVLKSGRWTKINYKGATRYVWGEDVKRAVFTGKMMKNDAFRTGSSIRAHIQKSLDKGIEFAVLIKGRYWDQGVYEGKIGYVWSKDVSQK